MIQEDVSGTLGCGNDQTIFQPFVLATQQGGAEIAIDLSPTITQAAGTSGNNQPVVCLLNDQGGGTKNRGGRCIAHTPGGGPPARAGGGATAVMTAGFIYKQGSKAGSIGFEHEIAPTLRAGLIGGAAVITSYAFDGAQVTNRLHRESGKPEICHSIHADSRHLLVIKESKADGLCGGLPKRRDQPKHKRNDPGKTRGGGKPKYKYRGTYSLSHEDFMCKPNWEVCGAILATDHKDPPVVAYEREDTDG